MATENITPNVGDTAPAAAPPAPTTPSPTAPTPPSSAAAPAAAAAQPPETTAAPAQEGPPTKQHGEDEKAFLLRWMDYQEKQKAQPAKPAEPVRADAKTEPPPVEAKPAETPKPAEPAKTEPEPPNPLDQLGPLPAEKVAQALEANPQLAEQLEAAGIDPEPLMESLRMAGEATQYKELYPTLEDAKFAQQQAGAFGQLDEAFTNLQPGDLASTQKFLVEALMPLSYVLDDDGKPRIDPATGQPQHDGTVVNFLDNLQGVMLDRLSHSIDEMRKSPDEAVRERADLADSALSVIKEMIDGTPPNAAEMTEEMKARQAQLDASERRLAEERKQASEAKFEEFRGSTRKAADEKIDGLITSIVNHSSLAPAEGDNQQEQERKRFLSEKVTTDIRNKLFEKLNGDALFLAEQEQIARRGSSEATQKALVALYNRKAQGYLRDVATPILKAAGAERIKQVAARAAKIQTQVAASKMEPRGGVQPAVPVSKTPLDPKALYAQAEKELRDKNQGRQPDPVDLIKLWQEKVAAAQVSA